MLICYQFAPISVTLSVAYYFFRFCFLFGSKRREALAEYCIHFGVRCDGAHLFSDTSPPTVSYLEEIWKTMSTLSGAGPGRFWATSVQQQMQKS